MGETERLRDKAETADSDVASRTDVVDEKGGSSSATPTARERPVAPAGVQIANAPLRAPYRLDRIDLPDEQVERLLEQGVVPGRVVSRIRNAPSGDPVLQIGGGQIALRRETANRLVVTPLD
ncbi:MAG: ferrous iron transport protein A [Gemmatimonadetes bacterium]|nr:ferrous iron transport protein A [Gemmatimonadota bacterium]